MSLVRAFVHLDEQGDEWIKVQDVIDRLTTLGLDPDEAAVYVHLSMMGPSKASDVAQAVKLHRTEAYRTLNDLVQRGFVSASLGRPTWFEATDPDALFERLLEEERARSETIQRAQVQIGSALATLRGNPDKHLRRNTFKVLQGRREIYAYLERMVRRGEEELKVLTTHPGAFSMSEMAGLVDLTRQRAREGVRVRSVLRTTPEIRERIASLPATGMEYRHLETARIMRFVVRDDEELLMWVVSDPSTRLTSEEDVAIWTDSPDFVGTQSELFETVWREADAIPLRREVGNPEASRLDQKAPARQDRTQLFGGRP